MTAENNSNTIDNRDNNRSRDSSGGGVRGWRGREPSRVQSSVRTQPLAGEIQRE